MKSYGVEMFIWNVKGVLFGDLNVGFGGEGGEGVLCLIVGLLNVFFLDG